MSKIRSHIDPKSEGFRENSEAYEELLLELRERSAQARRGGGEKARKRHEERGKLPVRDRIELLLDPGTAFLELSPLAAIGMYDGNVLDRMKPGSFLINCARGSIVDEHALKQRLESGQFDV